jgi:SSS family solute:Na+ symporter
MGHISGVINSCTTIATIDFYLPLMKSRARRRAPAAVAVSAGQYRTSDRELPVLEYASPQLEQPAEGATDAQAVAFGRLIGVLVIVFSILWSKVLLSRSNEPIFLYLLNRYGYFTPGIAVMFLAGILWKGATHAGALTAGVLTVPLSIWLERQWPHLPFQNRTGIVFWVCIAACILVSLVTPRKSDEELTGLVWTPASMKLPPEERARERGVRNPVIWWAAITAVTVFFYVWFA